MNSRRATWITIGVVVAFMVLVASVMAACNTTPNPAPAPTVTQECIEADGEPCDDDPLDLDDVFEKKKPTKAPCVKTRKNRCK